MGILEDTTSDRKFFVLMDSAFVRDFFSAFHFSFLGQYSGTDLSLRKKKGQLRTASHDTEMKAVSKLYGEDDTKYRDDNSIKVYHDQSSVKSAMHVKLAQHR